MGMIGHKTESMYRRYRFGDEVRMGEEDETLQAWATGQQKLMRAGGCVSQEAGVGELSQGLSPRP
jgi:hypothetical protein